MYYSRESGNFQYHMLECRAQMAAAH